MTEIKLTKRYPQSRTEDIVDAYMRGWNDALDAVQNGKFHIAEQTEPNSSEKPNNCETCRNKGFEGCEQPCLGCGCCGLYEPKDEPTTQTETQNSNLTFEKDECAKEYEELGLKELKELINADRKTENSSEKPNNCERQTEGVWNAGFKTGYDKGYKDAQKVKDSQDLVKDLVKAFCEDGTWLERQGVYTLTLAEAKQRAVDIIEAVSRKDEADTPQTKRTEHLVKSSQKPRDSHEIEQTELMVYPQVDGITPSVIEPKTEPQRDNSIGCSKCEGRYDCIDRDLPHAIHCNNYGKDTDCAWK